jgi:hypothetical protein
MDAHETLDGKSIRLIGLDESGGCDDDGVRHITIKTAGAPLEGPLVDRLIDAYRSRGWKCDVVPISAANE